MEQTGGYISKKIDDKTALAPRSRKGAVLSTACHRWLPRSTHTKHVDQTQAFVAASSARWGHSYLCTRVHSLVSPVSVASLFRALTVLLTS